MSLLSRVRSWIQGAAREGDARGTPVPDPEERAGTGDATARPLAAPEEAEARRTTGEIARLARVGMLDGPGADEAIALLRRVRGTVLEASALEAALRGFGERALPEAVRVACADILAARGDEQGALRVLFGISSTPGLILAADLYASSGQLARAVGTIERVLARDLDAPGARERHQRWSAALGYVRRPGAAARRGDRGGPFQGDGRALPPAARGGAGRGRHRVRGRGRAPGSQGGVQGLPRSRQGPGRARA